VTGQPSTSVDEPEAGEDELADEGGFADAGGPDDVERFAFGPQHLVVAPHTAGATAGASRMKLPPGSRRARGSVFAVSVATCARTVVVSVPARAAFASSLLTARSRRRRARSATTAA
jgi:hypothetical protein